MVGDDDDGIASEMFRLYERNPGGQDCRLEPELNNFLHSPNKPIQLVNSKQELNANTHIHQLKKKKM